MAFQWKYERMRERDLFQLHFQTKGAITARNMPDQKGELSFEKSLGSRDREVYRLGDWLVESKRRPYGLEILLQRTGGRSSLELAIESGTATANIRLLRKPMEERTCKKTKKVTVGAEKIEVEMEAAAPPTVPPMTEEEMTEKAAGLMADPEARKVLDSMVDKGQLDEKDREVLEGLAGKSIRDLPPEEVQKRLKELIKKEGIRKGGRRPPPQAAQEQQAKMALELQEARNQATAAKAQIQALEQSMAQLNAQLEEERKRNTDLQLAASTHLSELLATLAPQREALASAMQAQLDRAGEAAASLKEAEAQSEAARRQAEEAEKRLAEKRAEAEKYRSLETLRALDCGQLEKELTGLRGQLEADGYSMALLEEEAFFDAKKMQKQMEDAKKQLESLEIQLAEAVRQRERIDSMVQDTALKGDGVISLKKELG